ncbi:hypothetical protein ACL6C3_28885 [Capilliphycus salinus ALCB114379]|uniref:hypothetical protein n=1 Tax=Capilliphycus salinus TaxID=2768948 RepID=UPI0039A6918A
MIRFNLLSQSSVRLWGLLCGSLLMGFSAIAIAGGPPPQQGKPAIVEPQEEEETDEETDDEEMEEQATPQAPTTTPVQRLRDDQQRPQSSEPPPRFPEPSAILSLNGRQSVNIRLVNTTNGEITYQVIEGTGERTLGANSQVELQGLPIPLNLTYRRQDGGLLLVVPEAVEPGVLEVRFQPTGSFFLDTKSLNITGTGSVFLN